MDYRDRRQYHGEAEALLGLGSWSADDVDLATLLHDLLEAPEDAPDPVAKRLRTRLTGELERRLAEAENPADKIRYRVFSSSMLDVTDAPARRLFVLFYRGMTSFADYQSGSLGQLDVAIDSLLELDRAVTEAGPQASALLGNEYDAVLVGLAAACYTRYAGRRELLCLDLPADMAREIRADLEIAMDMSRRVAGKSGSPARAEGLATLGSCYAFRSEDDERRRGPGTAEPDPEMIDTAVRLLREALRLAEVTVRAQKTPEAVDSLLGIRDQLAGALAIRNTLQDVDAAIALYTKNRDEAPSASFYNAAGGAVSLATAYIRRWLLTRETPDLERARTACAEAFASGVATHLPAAFDIATQWGGLAWQERWWGEAGTAYQRATRVMHLAVRQQSSRSGQEWIVRKAPGVAAHAALGLARAGAFDDAFVTLETGRAALLAEMFDRRTVDHERIASLAGRQIANEYERLTDELTSLDARLLLAGAQGDSTITAEIEEKRRQRAALRARMGSAAENALAEMDGPPAIADLREAAGRATVVYLAATGEGGFALILRPGGGLVEHVELEDLTVVAATELAAALEHANTQDDKPDVALCAAVCDHLWPIAMESLLPRLCGAAEVVLIPGGMLSALPWHAAKLPGPSTGYVLDQVAISYMPNIRSLPVARTAWQDMKQPLRALAIEAPPSAGLPQTVDEIDAVLAHYGPDFRVTRLPGSEATAQRLWGALTQYEVIHFAGHAATCPDDPLAGAVELAHDETITVRELLANGIGAARFAVLSACDTARVEDLASDEMVSFPAALMQCGFGGVVGSLWPARDRATAKLMEAFYEQWRGRRATPREALRAAQQRTRDQPRYTSPLFWANFVYVGP